MSSLFGIQVWDASWWEPASSQAVHTLTRHPVSLAPSLRRLDEEIYCTLCDDDHRGLRVIRRAAGFYAIDADHRIRSLQFAGRRRTDPATVLAIARAIDDHIRRRLR